MIVIRFWLGRKAKIGDRQGCASRYPYREGLDLSPDSEMIPSRGVKPPRTDFRPERPASGCSISWWG